MPDEFTPEEERLLAESPADSANLLDDDPETEPNDAANPTPDETEQ
jgi:hypothetical protein